MDSSFRSIRLLIWIYFWLLLLEGALRKWAFPSLSGPLLIIRDPVVLAIYALAIGKGIFPWNKVVLATCALAIVSLIASIFVFNNLTITLFGLRTDFLHLPLIFVIPKVFQHRDVVRMGRWFLIVCLPMALLVAWQFASPSGAWVNAAAGGEAGQMIATGSRIRPPGTFSFVTGMVSFLGLVAAFLFNGLLNKRQLSRWLRLVAIPALVISLILSGSRSAVAGVTVIVVALLIICGRRFSRFGHIVGPAILGYLLFVMLCYFPLFRAGMEVHQERLDAGGGVQKGIVARYFGTFGESIEAAGRVPLLGYGLGIGTNVGSALLTGSRAFLLGESEWTRVIGESGPILGYAFLFLRVTICWILFWRSWVALRKGESLPFLLMASGVLDLISGQFGQPTTLGFSVLTAGLTLAAANLPLINRKSATLGTIPIRLIRGRSPVARALIENAVQGRVQEVRDVQLPKKGR